MTMPQDEFKRDLKHCLFCKSLTPHVGNKCLPCTAQEEQKEMYTQVWSCSKCGETGGVEYLEDADIERVFTMVLEDHRRRVPYCLEGGYKTISILPPIDSLN